MFRQTPLIKIIRYYPLLDRHNEQPLNKIAHDKTIDFYTGIKFI